MTVPPRPGTSPTDDGGVVIEVTVAAPIEVVWSYLRDPDLIQRWHGWEADSLADEIQVIYRTAVRETQPTLLELSGPGGPNDFDHGDRFELTEVDSGTRVRIVRAPIGNNPEWDDFYFDITQGWLSFLQQLRFSLEQQRGAERRTIFLSAAGAELSEAVALLGAADSPAAGGAEWHSDPHQRGVLLDDLGPGLVIAGDKPGPPENEVGMAMVIVTTYGLANEDFAAVDRRWQDWWAGHFPASTEPAGPGA